MQRTLNLSLIGVGAAAGVVFGTAQPANALLVFNIIEQVNGITIQGAGSVTLPDSPGPDLNTTQAQFINGPDTGVIVSGSSSSGNLYRILGPNTFGGTASTQTATSTSGDRITFQIGSANPNPSLGLPSGYISASPLFTTAFYSNATLAGLGITPGFRGSLGTWDVVNNANVAADQVQVFVVPGPLPILGAGVAFGFSRRLRRRIASSKSVAHTS